MVPKPLPFPLQSRFLTLSTPGVRRLKKFVKNLCVFSFLNIINRTHPNSTHTTWIMSFCLPCKADFLAELRFSVISLLIVRGPCASGYNTLSFLTSRLSLISVIQPCAHLEFEFLASQILISQWTNTKG